MSVTLRSKALKSGKKSYYLDIYHNGERNYEFLKIYTSPKDTKEDRKEKKLLADSIRAKRELAINSDEHDFIPSFKKKTDFIEYFETFIEEYNGAGVRKFKYSLKKFKTFYQKKKLPFSSLNKKICQDYYDHLKSKESGLSGETPYDYFKRFRTVINRAVDERIISKNPSKGIKIKNVGNELKKNILTKEELQKLVDTRCGNEIVKKAFLFACFSGLGIAEIRNLTWIEVINGELKTKRAKNQRQINFPLHDFSIKLIGEPQKANQLIFSPLPSDVSIGKNIKRWVKLAGIEKNISFYCGRHTFAVQLLLNGANLKTVADCMGHASIQHTLKYLNYVNELKGEAVSNLPNLDF